MKPTKTFIATIRIASDAAKINASMRRYLQWVILSNVRNSKSLGKNMDLVAQRYLSLSIQ